MLALVAANVVSIVLFVTLYAVAAARWLPQPAFLACLAAIFALVTTLWVCAETAQGRGREPLARVGRIAFALVVVLIAAPPLSLMPVFWLDNQLPPEAGFRAVIAPIMALLLIALGLTVVVNVVGGFVVVMRGARRRAAGRRDGEVH